MKSNESYKIQLCKSNRGLFQIRDLLGTISSHGLIRDYLKLGPVLNTDYFKLGPY